MFSVHFTRIHQALENASLVTTATLQTKLSLTRLVLSRKMYEPSSKNNGWFMTDFFLPLLASDIRSFLVALTAWWLKRTATSVTNFGLRMIPQANVRNRVWDLGPKINFLIHCLVCHASTYYHKKKTELVNVEAELSVQAEAAQKFVLKASHALFSTNCWDLSYSLSLWVVSASTQISSFDLSLLFVMIKKSLFTRECCTVGVLLLL